MSEKAGTIGVPSVKGMKNAFIDFLCGAGGGLAYALTSGIFGSGLIGLLAAPVLAGSIIKGERGTALATIAGFMLFAGLGSASTAQASSSGGTATI